MSGPVTKTRQGDALARTTTLLTGLVLTGVGGAALTRSLGVWDSIAGAGPETRSRLSLLRGDVARWFHDHGVVWPIAAVVGLILAYAGYRLLRRELRSKPAKARVVDLTDDSTVGTTRVAGSLATKAFVEDLSNIPGVENAAAAMRGDPAQPLVDVRLDIADDADVAAVLDEVEGGALVRLEQSLELRPAAVATEVRLTSAGGRRLI